MHEAFCQVGAPAFDEADMDLARRFRVTEPEEKQQALAKRGPVLDTAVPAQLNLNSPMGGSTDVGDVSYIVPTAQAAIACAAVGTGAHTWQFAAQAGGSIGEKGMLTAAKRNSWIRSAAAMCARCRMTLCRREEKRDGWLF